MHKKILEKIRAFNFKHEVPHSQYSLKMFDLKLTQVMEIEDLTFLTYIYLQIPSLT
jgi:hypothetical protein